MDLLDSMPVSSYWSKILFFEILTHISDLEVQVMDF